MFHYFHQIKGAIGETEMTDQSGQTDPKGQKDPTDLRGRREEQETGRRLLKRDTTVTKMRSQPPTSRLKIHPQGQIGRKMMTSHLFQGQHGTRPPQTYMTEIETETLETEATVKTDKQTDPRTLALTHTAHLTQTGQGTEDKVTDPITKIIDLVIIIGMISLLKLRPLINITIG